MWGSAALAQTQLTPGVSTLAAPRPTYKRAARENTRVNVSYALQLLGVVIAWAGLLASLFLLDREPLFGVLGTLAAFALLLSSLAKLLPASPRKATSLEDRTRRI